MRNKTGRQKRQPVADSTVQGALLLQTIFHWTMLVGAATTLVLLWQMLLSDQHATLSELVAQTWVRYAPMYVVMMALIPVIIYDSLRLTNRVAGPVVKLRGVLRRLAAGEKVEPIKFRKADHWQDIAETFNDVLKRVNASDDSKSAEATKTVA